MAKSMPKARKRPSGIVKKKPSTLPTAGAGSKAAASGKAAAVVFVVAPGASNKTSSEVKQCLQKFGAVHVFSYPGRGPPNLQARRQECLASHAKAVAAAQRKYPGHAVWLAGVSFGARCAAELLGPECSLLKQQSKVGGLIAFGYPLVALGDQQQADVKKRKQDRTLPLKGLPSYLRVLLLSSEGDPFLGGDRGALLKAVARKMKAKCTCCLLPGQQHQPVSSRSAEQIDAHLRTLLSAGKARGSH